MMLKTMGHELWLAVNGIFRIYDYFYKLDPPDWICRCKRD